MASDLTLPDDYAALLGDLKGRIRSAHTGGAGRQSGIGAAVLAHRAEHHCAVGAEGAGAKVIDRLARNLKYMHQFATAWPDEQVVQQLVAQTPWGHHIALLQALKDPAPREWYARAAIQHGWSRNVLIHQMDTRLIDLSTG